eukprot:gene1292-1426_t
MEILSKNIEGTDKPGALYFQGLDESLLSDFANEISFEDAASSEEDSLKHWFEKATPALKRAASWIVTAKAIGQIFGSVIIGRISDLYGRRRTLLVFLILEVVAYSLNAISNGYTMIIITRTIIGDSIVKHIQTNKILSKNPEINVNKIIAYTWSQVEETVADQNLTLPDNIVIHTGTNDLRDGISADEIINSAKKTADIILSRNANAHLTFSAIIPRGDNELLDIERQDVNLKMLKWCHNQERIEFVDNTNLVRGGINVKMYAQDKIHLNETGTKLPASNIGFSLKIQLQIAHLYQVPNRNPRGQGFRRRGSRNPQFDARGGHRGRSWSPAEYE